MAGTILARELRASPTVHLRFDVAAREDDAEIRRLLRANPMPGRVWLSFEREPDYFADASQGGETKQTIVARDSKGLACVGSCTLRRRFVNGVPCRVGYLGGLRLDSGHAGRFNILRRGYEFFRELQAEAPADFYFTSIAGDNQRARQLLERGLPGMPVYEFVGEFVTVLVPTHGRRPQNGAEQISKGGVSRRVENRDRVAWLNESNKDYQFAPEWSLEELRSLEAVGLRETDFWVLRDGDKVTASAALWDQRVFRQTVIRGYSPALALARPALNVVAWLLRRARLPAAGEILSSAFVSHLTMRSAEAGVLIELAGQLRRRCIQRGLELLTLGFAANDPRLATIRANFRGHEYRSRLYVVRWPGLGGAAGDLEDRILAPEVALL